jgi:hypothetical protein
MADVTSPFGFPYPEDTDLVRDGASDIENLAEGVNDYLAGGYLYAGTEYYTSSGTFAKADPLGTGDIGLRAVRVRLVGGGGGGAGAPSTTGSQGAPAGGGGSGAYSESFILASALSSSETVTRGAGGAGGVGANGTNGATSSFGTLVTAGGGTGGAQRAASTALQGVQGQAGGAVGTGDFSIPGSGGGSSYVVNPSLFFGVIGGNGGPSVFGGAGRGAPSDVAAETSAAGSGGAGRPNHASQATATGAAGGNGIVIVDCFV